MSSSIEPEEVPLRTLPSIMKTIASAPTSECCSTTKNSRGSRSRSIVLYIFGVLSIIIAILQMVSYVLYLRFSTLDGDFLYITLFTGLGGLNFIFVWHVCRLLYMRHQGRYSRCSAASSRVWFYTSLFYLLANVLQIGWFYCLEDWVPFGLSVIAVTFCFVLFVYGSRKLHRLKAQEGIDPVVGD